MAVTSLTRMTVPVASDQSNPSQGLLMPKLKYRFRVIFENFGVSTPTTELTKQVVDFRRPSVSFEDILIPVYNSTLKLAGKYSWAEVTCTLRDDAKGDVAVLVGEQIQKQMDFFEMASASSGIDYKFTTKFQVLDGGSGNTPVVLEQWELYGCYLKQADWGDMNYGTNEPATITMTIQFDNAAQTEGGAVGIQGATGALGRTLGELVTGAGTAQTTI
jgi:hypothetical protein